MSKFPLYIALLNTKCIKPYLVMHTLILEYISFPDLTEMKTPSF